MGAVMILSYVIQHMLQKTVQHLTQFFSRPIPGFDQIFS